MKTTASSSNPADASQPDHGRRLAYLLSIYPAISHTFFLNEILELRKLGFTIDVASINRPPPVGATASPHVIDALKNTFYIKAGKPAHIVLTLLRTLVTQPLVVLRGLRAALALRPSDLHTTAYALFYLVEALILGDWLRERNHHHLHIHFGGPVATVGMLTSIAWGIPYSLMIHGPEEFYDVGEFYLRRKVEHAQFVLCISDYCRSQLMKITDPAHWSKLLVVRLGVDPLLFAPAPATDPRDVVEILCVGRLVPAKGQLILLRAIANLLARGHKLRLRLIGDGPDRNTLRSFLIQQSLINDVVLEGALDHEVTRMYLAESDIFVLASFAEGLPVALMEAMAMEVPCVSTYVAAIPELIRDGIDGLLVPPSSEEALTVALERLISNPELRRSLALSSRERVLEHYNLQKNTRLLADTLHSQISRQS